MTPFDPMESFEQAEIEADERFYENRDDDDEDDEPAENPREKGDDDGQEYGDPRDEQEDRLRSLDARFDQLMGFVLGPRPE